MMRTADPLQRLVPQVIIVYLPPDRPGLQPAERYVGEEFGEHRQQIDEHIAGHPSRVALPGGSSSGGPILPLSEARPVEVSEDRPLLHRAMLLDRTDMLDEGVPRLGLRTHRQHGLIESVHHLAQQQSADSATPRACPDAAAGPEEPGIFFLMRRTGPAERGSDGARDLVALHCHPASELDHRIGPLDFPPGLVVIENGLVRQKLAVDGTSCLVKRRPQFVADGMRVERSDMDGHNFLSGFRAKRVLRSKVTASGSGPTSRIAGSTWRAFGPIGITACAVAGSRTARR